MAKSTTPRAIVLLLKLDFRRLGGWNEFAHSRDPKVRRRWLGLALLWFLLVGIVLFYLVMMAMGMAVFGLMDLLPGCLYTGATLAVLLFEMLRAGNFLFQPGFFEQTAPLPLPLAALPVSRLVELYLCDLALCALLLGPGLILYPIADHSVGLGYGAAALWGLLLAPMPAGALACLLGALTAFVVRRIRHKNLVAGLLLVAFTVGVLVWSLSLSALPANVSEEELLSGLRPALQAAARAYPPAAWFGQALAGGTGSAWALLKLTLLSLGAAGLAGSVVTMYYPRLCTALNAPAGRRRNAREAGVHTPLTALYVREARRYFSCSVWFANTVIGYLLMAALPLLLLLGGDRVVQALELTPETAGRFLPVILGLMATLMPVTSSSISLEGAQWSLIRTLPVRPRDLLLAKILLNLTIALPCWCVAIVGGILALHPGGTDLLWLVLVPALYCVFGAVAALRINLAFPQLHWKSETQAVKQSAAALLSMLAGFAAAGLPALCLLFAPKDWVYTVLSLLLAILTLLLWRQCLHVDLQKIQ